MPDRESCFDETDELLTAEEVSEITRKPLQALATLRHRKQGPPWTKVGGTPLYSKRGLYAFMQANAIGVSLQNEA